MYKNCLISTIDEIYILPKDSKQVEIVGTCVISEFGAYSMLILGISVIGLIFFCQKILFWKQFA